MHAVYLKSAEGWSGVLRLTNHQLGKTGSSLYWGGGYWINRLSEHLDLVTNRLTFCPGLSFKTEHDQVTTYS